MTISQQTLNDSAKKAKEAADKTKETADKRRRRMRRKKKLAESKGADERKGKLDEAIKKADEAATLDPANKEASELWPTKWKTRNNMARSHEARQSRLIDESKVRCTDHSAS